MTYKASVATAGLHAGMTEPQGHALCAMTYKASVATDRLRAGMTEPQGHVLCTMTIFAKCSGF